MPDTDTKIDEILKDVSFIASTAGDKVARQEVPAEEATEKVMFVIERAHAALTALIREAQQDILNKLPSTTVYGVEWTKPENTPLPAKNMDVVLMTDVQAALEPAPRQEGGKE